MPYVIEPAAGADRATLAFLLAAYDEEEVKGREAHGAAPRPPPRADQGRGAAALAQREARAARRATSPTALRPHFMIDVDDAGSIGRRYRRQDEVGTPLCVTVDFDSLDDAAVTVRDRDTMEQERVPIDELVADAPRPARSLAVSMMDDYYELLGVDADAPADDIRAAYRDKKAESLDADERRRPRPTRPR